MTLLSSDIIKRAITHPEREVRLLALEYFTESHAGDESVMAQVIESVVRAGLWQAR